MCPRDPPSSPPHTLSAGSTDTSLWTHYKRGERRYCGNDFPDGMRKNDRLARNVITPTTKAETHDEPISPQEIVARGLMSQVGGGGCNGEAALGVAGQVVAHPAPHASLLPARTLTLAPSRPLPRPPIPPLPSG